MPDCTIDDLDPSALAEYRRNRAESSPTAPELSYSDDDLLLSLFAVSRVDGRLVPTIAGLLLFGKRMSLRRHFPMTRIDYIRVPGREWVRDPDRRFDTVEVLDPLLLSIPRVINTILDDIPTAFTLPAGSSQRKDMPLIPRTAVREAVVNALMHRSYRQKSAVQIIRYANRLEIRNPGHSLVPDDRLGEPGSVSRNEKIAAVLHETRYAETKGSGIRAMRKAMTDQNLTPPTFESDREKDNFVVTFLFHHFLNSDDVKWLGHFSDLGLNEDEQKALVYAREMGAINNPAYRDINQVETLVASGHLRRLRDLKLFEQKGRSNQTYYVPTERMLRPQSFKITPAPTAKAQRSTSAPSGKPTRLNPVGKAQSTELPSNLQSLPTELAAMVAALSPRSAMAALRKVIIGLCQWKPLTSQELSEILRRNKHSDYIASAGDDPGWSACLRIPPTTGTSPASLQGSGQAGAEMTGDADQLPEGWTRATLAEITVKKVEQTGPKSRAAAFDYIDISSIDNDSKSIVTPKRIPSEGAPSRAKQNIDAGDVLVSMTRPNLNAVGMVQEELAGAIASTGFDVLRAKDAIDPGWLFMVVRSAAFVDAMTEQVQGALYPAVRPRDIRGFEIPLPPFAEQRRIVGKVEEVLGRVNAARQRLAKVPAFLKRFRQSTLAAACSGRLTAEWRDENTSAESAADLLTRLKEEREKKWRYRNAARKYQPPQPVAEEQLPDLPPTWAWTNFDHCAWEITVGHVGPMKERYVAQGVRFLRSQNVRPLRFDADGQVFIPDEFHVALRKSALTGGEILVTRSGANTGDCCVYPRDAGNANCSDLVITRPLSGMLSEYGASYIASPEGQERIGVNETGIAQPHFNIGAMRVKAFPLPPLPEQHEIVRLVEALFALADKIEARVASASARADKLIQSTLAKAFRGELVPTEHALAQGAGRTYESAEQLLARIKSTPSPAPPLKSAPKKKNGKALA